jgi:hypothetical protein
MGMVNQTRRLGLAVPSLSLFHRLVAEATETFKLIHYRLAGR